MLVTKKYCFGEFSYLIVLILAIISFNWCSMGLLHLSPICNVLIPLARHIICAVKLGCFGQLNWANCIMQSISNEIFNPVHRMEDCHLLVFKTKHHVHCQKTLMAPFGQREASCKEPAVLDSTGQYRKRQVTMQRTNTVLWQLNGCLLLVLVNLNWGFLINRQFILLPLC